MTKIRAALSLGVCVAVVGVLVTMNSSALATRWESLGPSSWGGTTDPAVARSWWTLGVALLAPGVALPLRVLEIVVASTVLALLWASAPLFPSPELPAR